MRVLSWLFRGLKAIEVKGVHYPKLAILHGLFFHVRHAFTHRDLVEILSERGETVGHATPYRWGAKFASLIAARAQARIRQSGLHSI